MAAHGDGTYNGFVRVLPPERVRAELAGARERWREFVVVGEEERYWEADLTPGQVLEAIYFMDTVDGIEFAFHPDHPDRICCIDYLDDKPEIWSAGSTLGKAIEWALGSGVLTSRSRSLVLRADGSLEERDFRYFAPSGDMGTVWFGGVRSGSDIVGFLRSYAATHADGAVFVVREPGRERWFQLFVGPIGGEIRYVPAFEEAGGPSITMEYGEQANADVLAEFTAYFSRSCGWSR